MDTSFFRHFLPRRAGEGAALAGDVFDTWALDGRDARMERGHGPVARRVFDSLRLADDAWYLDIGCGNGYTVRWASAILPRGRAYGIDASRRMVDRARRLSEGDPCARFAVAAFPLHDLPLASFDAIFSMETLYYMPDIPTALREIRRLLKPGGVFVSAIDYYTENRISHDWRSYVGARMSLWSERHWRRAFEQAGFVSVAQERLLIPAKEAVERWHTTVGSLVTRGSRPTNS
jgi:SAM-dependent methyltransferase